MNSNLVADFVLVLMIFLRIIAAFTAAPVFSHSAFPMLPRIFLSFVIAYIIFLMPGVKQEIQFSLWWLFITGVKEILTGLIIGFALNMVFFGISYAGTLIGFDMGLSMAEIFNASSETENNIVGELISFSSIIIFLIINGHHYLIRGLALSFSVLPVGGFNMNKPLFELLVRYSGTIFIIAVKIASPIMVSFFLIHIAEGIISKVIPQMQVFFVTQPLKIGVGFLLLSAIMPVYVFVIKNLLRSCEDSLYSLVKAMGA